MELEPEANGTKYLNLAEFLPGKESIKAISKGLELLKAEREKLLATVLDEIYTKIGENNRSSRLSKTNG